MFCGGFVLASAVNVAFLALLLLFAVVYLIDFETNLQVAQFHLNLHVRRYNRFQIYFYC